MARSTTARLPVGRRRAGNRAGLVFAVVLVTAALSFVLSPAIAQTPTAPGSRPSTTINDPPPFLGNKPDPNAQMLVQANELQYDYANERVSAVGRVQIYYGGSTLEADKVIYDQKTKRLHAEGNVRLVEQNGNVVYGEVLDLSDDYRDGFIDSLRLDTPDKTRFASARAERTNGNATVFQSGVYTACEACKDNPKKPPLWQVKAARIIHDQNERMIYFENARIEFFGVPLAYTPYFSTPDPTVKRKTGLLFPMILTSNYYGVAVEVPFFWALAPNYDVTFNPRYTTRQGLLMQGEWRHRLLNGAYSIRGYGIFQQDQAFFQNTPGDRYSRGSIETVGQFALSDQWVWGWQAALLSDKTFYSDYSLIPTSVVPSGAAEATSQIYLIGQGDRSYFSARSLYYLGFSSQDNQSQIPVIAPVIDYSNVIDRPVFGGEFSYVANFVSMNRQTADYNAITQAALNAGACSPTADPAQLTRANCLLRGVPATYTRFSTLADWRRSYTDSFGQVFTPFVRLRGDVAALKTDAQPGVANFINTGQETLGRVMPTVGVEYRYPFIAVHSWGTQTIEPIAQVIVRPDETNIGRFPNEDAQSFIFDDANLFSIDKFPGWDRVEGGTRANVGVQYTAQFNRSGYVNALFGQSYQLFGKNSFATADNANSTLDSGLDKNISDYIARLSFQPNKMYGVYSRFRFDDRNFAVRRLELEGRVNLDRWSFSAMYGNYDAQPDIGYLTRRQGILTSASYKLNTNWSIFGSARYDLERSQINALSTGLGYLDECFAINITYSVSYGYGYTDVTQPNQTVGVAIKLRTLGETNFSQAVGPQSGTSSPLGF